jgi:cysteine desulfurase
VNVLPNGHIDLAHLQALLETHSEKTIVSIMHANNEIGNMIDLHTVGAICKKYNAYFHSDTVQTVGHFPFKLSDTPVDFITGAGHKFHGPKGVGILYINENIKISPFLHGGAQERNMRAGTENVYGIVGFAKALSLATENHEKDSAYINDLKKYMHDQLIAHIPGVSFNGDTFGESLYTLLSVNFPKNEKSEMMLFNLDIHHICASGGSACSSGAQQGSHVINALNKGNDIATVRFSFSKYNTKAEIDTVIQTLKELV